MTKPKRAERVIDFSSMDVLIGLPPATKFYDLWYDKMQPYLCFRQENGIGERKIKRGFFVVAGNREVRGAFRQGVTVRRTTAVNMAGGLEDIKEQARLMWEQYQKYREDGKASSQKGSDPSRQKKIPRERSVVPQAILEVQPVTDNPNYDKLMSILMDAYEQAASGKGVERHGNGLNFEDQDMMQVMDRVGINFALGQAIKKITEGRRLKKGKATTEFLRAIVYLAGAIIWMDK